MTRIPDAVSVASLDTHRLIVAVPNEGPAEISCNLPRTVAADVLRQLADNLDSPAGRCATAILTGHPCPVHDAPGHDDRRPTIPLDPSDIRGALDFNAGRSDQVLASLRDVLLDTETPRDPEQALAAARILFEAHARQIAALVEAHYSATRARWGLSRSTRGLLTGYEGARKIVTAYADGLAAEQALAEGAASK
ncbi:hypothetical protein [Streptomyces sp. MBT53]|uniref:hypothetical protein n=1 Tax=Streptomyces sp. MBT53 TaxID=1488384 RepID=UPI0019118FAD|nr:hypothetical protein [Streptomyces sp. MBT53]MBK6018528.1 hypothetical protein [Streptomyces sp. MBT53]